MTPNEGIDDDSTCGTSASLVPNKQGCMNDNVEEDNCVTQMLQDQFDASSCEVEIVHKADSSHNLENHLKVNEDKIVAILSHYDKSTQIV